MAEKKPSFYVSVTEAPEPASITNFTEIEIENPAVASSDPLQHTAQTKNILSGWLIEICAVIAAALSLAASAGVLAAFEAKKISALPFKIGLATALSILAKVNEATIGLIIAACLSQIMWMRYRSRARPLTDFAVYDAASRGTSGQALFLLQRGHNIKGYVGVALALLALALGPSYQQTIKYDIVNGKATLGRCFKSNHSRSPDNMYNALHLALYYDINSVGTARDGVFQSLNGDCITGNCAWPTFASLGICGACVDVSDKVIQECALTQDVAKGPVIGCNASLPSLNDVTVVNNYTDPFVGHRQASMSRNTHGSYLGSVYGNAVSYDFSSLRYSDGDILHASSCVLYYCVRGYESVVTNSTLKENVTLAWSNPNALKVLGEAYPSFSKPKTLEGPYNDTVLTPPQSEWSKLNLTEPTNFTMDWYTDARLKFYFSQAFDGTYYTYYDDGYAAEGNDGQDVLVMQIFKNLWGQDPAQQNMSKIVNGLAIEMTSIMRDTCDTADFVQGTSKNLAVVLNVAWFWLVFPGFLLVTTSGFLLAVMIESRRRGAMTWKTGIFPLLFHGMGVARPSLQSEDNVHGPAVCQELSPQVTNELENVSGMRKQARVMRVRLERNQSGAWHLSKHEQPSV